MYLAPPLDSARFSDVYHRDISFFSLKTNVVPLSAAGSARGQPAGVFVAFCPTGISYLWREMEVSKLSNQAVCSQANVLEPPTACAVLPFEAFLSIFADTRYNF